MVECRKLKQLFPSRSEIPAQYRPNEPVHQRCIWVDGELRRWDGPNQTAVSPIWTRNDGGGLEATEIGSYPEGIARSNGGGARCGPCSLCKWPRPMADHDGRRQNRLHGGVHTANTGAKDRGRPPHHVGSRQDPARLGKRNSIAPSPTLPQPSMRSRNWTTTAPALSSPKERSARFAARRLASSCAWARTIIR